MGAPKMSESHKKIHGINLLKDYELRKKQMIFFLENMKEPKFDLEEQNDNVHLNASKITFRLMNHQGYGRGEHVDRPSYGSVAVFMNSIQDYLPKFLHRVSETATNKCVSPLWKRDSFRASNTLAEDTVELLEAMIDRMEVLREKIEDFLTGRYYCSNKNQYLEILKRRYKQNWSERTEQSIDADVKEDTNVNIMIEDYTNNA